MRRIEFPAVPHSHIVPAGYLRAWAHDGRIAMRLVGDSEEKLVGLRDAGVRRNFYRRERPNGDTIYDIEWSLAQAESTALPVIRDLAGTWPPSRQAKSKIGQFFALQYLRGPEFKAWHEQHLDPQIKELRTEPERYARPAPGMTAQEAIERYIEHLRSDTYRSVRMLKMVRSFGILLCSMHWTLLESRGTTFVTSDHPVVVWPLARGRAAPASNDLAAGVHNTLEVFVASGPAHLVLMSWAFETDTQEIQQADADQATTANAFMVANAESQWFHEPGATPVLADGLASPLSSTSLVGYDARIAAASPLRAQAHALSIAEAEKPLSNEPISTVAVDVTPGTSRGAGGGRAPLDKRSHRRPRRD